jgi:hypothetical protein
MDSSLPLEPKKSCDPQPFSGDQPSHAWELEKLSRYAQKQHQIIIAGEKQITPAYWRLGQALQIARKQFCRGQWGLYLADLCIDKSRASKARAIFATFSTEQKVANLPVDEAYGRRKRCETQRPRKRLRTGGGPATLHSFLDQIPENANQLVQEAGKVDPDQYQQLLGEVARAIEQLELLRAYLQQQVSLAAGNKPTDGSRARATSRRPREVETNGRAGEGHFLPRRRRSTRRRLR